MPPEAPYPDVYTDTFIFFPDHCVKLYGWMCITFQMPLVQSLFRKSNEKYTNIHHAGFLCDSDCRVLGSSSHRVQRLMLSKEAKRWIWDDITRFSQYFWQMTITRSEDISKNDTSISNLLKKLSYRKYFGTVLTEEIRIAKFCTEVFVMPKHLMTKLNIPESSLYMSLLHAIVLS